MKNTPHSLSRSVAAVVRRIVLPLVLIAAPCISRAAVATLDDLNYWGSGTNRAALVIDWNDGKSNETIAWGFRWTGSLSVADILFSLANSDPRLFARIDSAGSFGAGIFGLGYDNNDNALFSVTGALDPLANPVNPVFTNGISDTNTAPETYQAPSSSASTASGEIADHYAEGWLDNGFWELYTGSGSNFPTWTSSFDGASGTTAANDGWYAFSITSPAYDSNIPGAAVAAVPEPSSVLLLISGGVAIFWIRRKLHA